MRKTINHIGMVEVPRRRNTLDKQVNLQGPVRGKTLPQQYMAGFRKGASKGTFGGNCYNFATICSSEIDTLTENVIISGTREWRNWQTHWT